MMKKPVAKRKGSAKSRPEEKRELEDARLEAKALRAKLGFYESQFSLVKSRRRRSVAALYMAKGTLYRHAGWNANSGGLTLGQAAAVIEDALKYVEEAIAEALGIVTAEMMLNISGSERDGT